MTRINTIPVECLLDQHLMAEYRELPMVVASLKRSLVAARGYPLKIPAKFTLNTGHVSFFYNKGPWLRLRWKALIKELKLRSYAIDPNERIVDWALFDTTPQIVWEPTIVDKMLSLKRILVRFSQKPNWYRLRGETISVATYTKEVVHALSK